MSFLDNESSICRAKVKMHREKKCANNYTVLTDRNNVDVHLDVPLDVIHPMVRRSVRDHEVYTPGLQDAVHLLQHGLNVLQVVLRAQHGVKQRYIK